MDDEKGITVITANNDEPAPKKTEPEEMEGVPQWAKDLSEKMDKLLNPTQPPKPVEPAQPLKSSKIPSPPPPPKPPEPDPAQLKKESTIGKIVKFLF